MTSLLTRAALGVYQRLLRPVLFRWGGGDPERIHEAMISLLGHVPATRSAEVAAPVTVRGIEFDPGATFLGRPVLSYVGLESSEISVGAGSLPQGLSLSRVSVTDKGLRLSLSGSDVEMADL